VDINAAIEHMRSRNEPMYGAWEVCKAAGIDPKRQARLFAHASIISFMDERGLLYTKARMGNGRMLAVVSAAEALRKPERAQSIREEHLESVRRSTEKARESRRHYKKRGKEDNANAPSLHPFTLEEARKVIEVIDARDKHHKKTLEAFRSGRMSEGEFLSTPDELPDPEHRAIMRRVRSPIIGYPYDMTLSTPEEMLQVIKDGGKPNADGLFWLDDDDRDPDRIAHVAKARERTVEEMTPPPPSEILTAPTIRRMRLLVQQADSKEFNAKWELERPQREAKEREEQKEAARHKRKMANYTARRRQDEVAAEAAYRLGLVVRVDLPDPDQLELLDLLAA
jgi:hypothetical protein